MNEIPATIFKAKLTNNNTINLDLSVDSTEFDFDKINSQKALGKAIFNRIRQEGKTYGIGGYLEKRNLYNKFDNFEKTDRIYHIGVDVWTEELAAIHAPYDAVVELSYYHELEGDYGGLIILRHELNGQTIYSLFGHLSESSIRSNSLNKRIKKGEQFAFLGNEKENGNWPIHLHFQLILNNNFPDYNFPGVSAASDLDYFKSICPNPINWLKF